MEDTLGVSDIKNVRIFIDGLNPCSNGRYSRRVRGVKALFQAGGRVVRLIKLSFVNRN